MTPRSDEQNAQIKDERREQILSAALKVFARRGYAATKIGDIADQAGVSHGLVYHYFQSKKEVFGELLKRAISTSAQSILAAGAARSGPLEKVRTLARCILESIGNYEDSAYYFMIVIHASVMETPEGNREMVDNWAVTAQSLVQILMEGQQSGEIREGDPIGMAMAFFAAIQGLAIFKLTVRGFQMPDPEILVNMVKKQ